MGLLRDAIVSWAECLERQWTAPSVEARQRDRELQPHLEKMIGAFIRADDHDAYDRLAMAALRSTLDLDGEVDRTRWLLGTAGADAYPPFIAEIRLRQLELEKSFRAVVIELKRLPKPIPLVSTHRLVRHIDGRWSGSFTVHHLATDVGGHRNWYMADFVTSQNGDTIHRYQWSFCQHQVVFGGVNSGQRYQGLQFSVPGLERLDGDC